MRSNSTKDDFQNSLNQQEENNWVGQHQSRLDDQEDPTGRTNISEEGLGPNQQPSNAKSKEQAALADRLGMLSGAGQAGLARGRPGPSQLPSLRPKKALPEELASLVLKAIQATECNNQTAADMYYDMYRTLTGASAEEPTQTPNLK
ncbi:hypothetical protein PCANC_03443 [Puccinia coronata f. sp. avenae]|uniref:Uncharacterized protein n=1 Tax=Puccinia coronata f. sp. avenae TaxID=200324 RepID=A0A2N5W2E6_9BASI|nr:hypothetical protein PCANC_03443 [Puccinia coronata f. sp. avenae]